MADEGSDDEVWAVVEAHVRLVMFRSASERSKWLWDALLSAD